MPPQMTWSGENLDVAAGVLSLAGGLVLLAGPSRPLAIGRHIVGLVLLLNVIRVALTSLPSPLRAFDQVLYLPYHLPFALILPFAVMTALFVHIVALRALITGEGEARADFERISESV